MADSHFDEVFDSTLEEFLAEEKKRGSQLYRGTEAGMDLICDEALSPNLLESYIISITKAPPAVVVALHNPNYQSVAGRLFKKLRMKFEVELIGYL